MLLNENKITGYYIYAIILKEHICTYILYINIYIFTYVNIYICKNIFSYLPRITIKINTNKNSNSDCRRKRNWVARVWSMYIEQGDNT